MVLQLVLGNDNFQVSSLESNQALQWNGVQSHQLEVRGLYFEICKAFSVGTLNENKISSNKVYNWLTFIEFFNWSENETLTQADFQLEN